MHEQTLEEKVKSYIKSQVMKIAMLNDEEAGLNSTFKAMGVDSMELAELVTKIEETFDIELKIDDSFNLTKSTINNTTPLIIDLINKKNGK